MIKLTRRELFNVAAAAAISPLLPSVAPAAPAIPTGGAVNMRILAQGGYVSAYTGMDEKTLAAIRLSRAYEQAGRYR
jgi:hypothetical protein